MAPPEAPRPATPLALLPTPVDECPTVLPGGALALATVAFAAGCGTGTREATTASRGQADETGGNLLTEDNFTIKSILEIDLDKSTATFPSTRGSGPTARRRSGTSSPRRAISAWPTT